MAEDQGKFQIAPTGGSADPAPTVKPTLKKNTLPDRNLARVVNLIHGRPQPPREVKFSGGILSWKPPQITKGITHYRIYAPDEKTIAREVPAGQTFLQDNLSSPRVFITSFSKPLGLESAQVQLPDRMISGYILAEFQIEGAVSVGEDLVIRPTPLPLSTLGSNLRAIPIDARIVVKGVGSGADPLIIDVLYSVNNACVAEAPDPLDRTWLSVFRDMTAAELEEAELETDDNRYRLILPVGYEQLCTPIDTMANNPVPELPSETIFRLDCLQSAGETDMTVGIMFGIVKVNE